MVKTIKKIFAYLLFLILLIWICGYGVFLLHIRTLKPQQPRQKTDVIIVLTGGSSRIDVGLDIYTNDLAPRLFISGVHNSVKKSEIKAMWHGENPLPKCCIILGHDATTTIGNALEVNKWIKDNNIQSIRLVTSNYHMPRALMEFSNVDAPTSVKIIAHPVNEKETMKHYILAFKEYNKVIFRWSVIALRKQGLPI
jgi:uncharacterized SAM-binding protein YcdF (DUF218 family)